LGETWLTTIAGAESLDLDFDRERLRAAPELVEPDSGATFRSSKESCAAALE
jgi:hypothetical protein